MRILEHFIKSFCLLFLFFIMLSGCSRKCENIKVGETQLSSETLSFFNYIQDEKITFQTSNGSEQVFSVNIMENKYFICQKITCKPLDPYENDYCEYIEAPIKEVFLNSDSTLLGIDASVFAYEPESDLFYESVRFTISPFSGGLTASHITQVRFTNPEFDKNNIPDIQNLVDDFQTIQFNNISYTNVLSFRKDGIGFYFNKESGFIAFEVDGKIWVKQ